MTEHTKKIDDLLSMFSTFELEELNSLNLMDRYDDKTYFHRSKLPGLMDSLKDVADVLSIDGITTFEYESMYLDTPEMDLYFRHHNKRKNRFKMRYRKYVDSDLNFFEIKHKNLRGLMSKIRIETDKLSEDSLKDYVSENTPYHMDDLRESLKVTYYRSTLMNRERTESLTIDQQLSFENHDAKTKAYKNLVILELKQKSFNSNSAFRQVLKKANIRMAPISKYCLGISVLNPDLKSNAFRKQQREVQKIESHA